MGRFLPPDPSKGDENTVGGYMAVHSRPAAFEGSDGASYSVEAVAGETGDGNRPWGGYLLFVRWTPGDPSPEGHLETGFLTYADTEEAATSSVGALRLSDARRELNALIASRATSARPWWDAMRDDEAGSP